MTSPIAPNSRECGVISFARRSYNMKMKKRLVFIIIVTTIIFLYFFLKQINSINDIIYIFRNRNNFYSLQKEDVPVSKILQKCNELNKCRLEKGDILIRRYMTKNVWLLTKFTHPHFTHSAIYIGNNEIIEASGKEKDRSLDIRIINIDKSDWLQNDIEEIAIFRPILSEQSTVRIIDPLTTIANDPDYYFGLHKFDAKRSTCAELIYDQLQSQGLVHDADYNDKVTPDFLFHNLINQKDKFELVQ